MYLTIIAIILFSSIQSLYIGFSCNFILCYEYKFKINVSIFAAHFAVYFIVYRYTIVIKTDQKRLKNSVEIFSIIGCVREFASEIQDHRFDEASTAVRLHQCSDFFGVLSPIEFADAFFKLNI